MMQNTANSRNIARQVTFHYLLFEKVFCAPCTSAPVEHTFRIIYAPTLSLFKQKNIVGSYDAEM